MVNWASEQGLAIVDTFFPHATGDYWTYCKGDFRSKLDYFAIDKDIIAKVNAAEVSETIGTGLDHRTIGMTLELDSATATPKIDDRLSGAKGDDKTAWMLFEAGEKCAVIEQILLEAATEQQELEKCGRADDAKPP
jgi:hypothetical protein